MTSFAVISADSHTMEPPDLWIKHIDPKFRDRAPRVVRRDGTDYFEMEGIDLLPVPVVGAAGVPSDQIPLEGTFEDRTRRGGWDPHARLDDMRIDGVDAEVLYPTQAARLFALKDHALQLACIQAYNDWVTEFCSAYPDRHKAIGIIPLADVETGISELTRCKELGMVGGAITISPTTERTYSEPAYDPFWAAAEEMGVPISLHILTQEQQLNGGTYVLGPTEAVWAQVALSNMIFGGVFERFPNLKVVSAECDVGWAPYFKERLNYLFDRRQKLPTYSFGLSRGNTPSEHFDRNVYLTFMRDGTWVPARGLLNIDHIMWSNDYPHNDSTWPHSQKVIADIFDGVPEPERRKVLAENAASLYGFE